jgi:tripartite-type tricarboxylate transporter receptor subunit TctC
MLRLPTALAVALAAFFAGPAATAQNYPARAITMIVPFPAGGATDTLARYLGERMRAILGQPVVVENVGGAAGSIGVARAVRAAPADGYTLSIGTSTTHMLTGGGHPDLGIDQQGPDALRALQKAGRALVGDHQGLGHQGRLT